MSKVYMINDDISCWVLTRVIEGEERMIPYLNFTGSSFQYGIENVMSIATTLEICNMKDVDELEAKIIENLEKDFGIVNREYLKKFKERFTNPEYVYKMNFDELRFLTDFLLLTVHDRERYNIEPTSFGSYDALMEQQLIDFRSIMWRGGNFWGEPEKRRTHEEWTKELEGHMATYWKKHNGLNPETMFNQFMEACKDIDDTKKPHPFKGVCGMEYLKKLIK